MAVIARLRAALLCQKTVLIIRGQFPGTLRLCTRWRWHLGSCRWR